MNSCLICLYVASMATSRKQAPKYRFCPACGNILYLDETKSGLCYRLSCPTCPLYFNITKTIVNSFPVTEFGGQDQDEIVDENKSNVHRQKTEVICPECNNNEAYFFQMQTRSADEPMTNFYECTNTKCKHNWRD